MSEPGAAESLEEVQARHRKEQRELVARVTSKKKNATKKTRKGVNDECAELERQLKERHAEEIARVEHQGDDNIDGVTTQLDDATLSDEPAPVGAEEEDKTEEEEATEPQEKEQQQQQQQQGGKKRNRQKDRLARRAAEQEAAALKAEEEAANMTDHRGEERKYMNGVFQKNALVEKDIRPDGHCLFSAMADQLRQLDIALTDDEADIKRYFPYQLVRRAAAGWMEAHPDDFAPFLEEGLEGYVDKIRETAEWGGQLELVALAARYGVEIRVVQDGRTEKIDPPVSNSNNDGNGGDAEAASEPRTAWLAFYRHGYGLGEHYNSLRRAAA